MNKTVKWILIIMGIVIVALVVVMSMKKSDKEGIKVTAETVQSRTIIETVNASGKIYPEIEVKISPVISGEVIELNVQEGDSVRKGQILARINADIYASQRDEAAARVQQSQATVENSRAALDAIKAQLDLDKIAYERNKKLFDENVISRAELEQYEGKLKTTQAQYNSALQNIKSLQAATQGTRSGLNMASKTLGKTTVIAPMNGVITMLKVKKGETVVGTAQMAGTEMMVVSDLTNMEVRVEVDENAIVKVNIGDSANVEIEAYNNRKFSGVVTQIANSTTKSGNTMQATADVTNYEVRIRLNPASYQDLMDPSRPKKFPFRPGMNARADIKTRRKDNVVSVPVGAVASRAKGSDENIEEKKKEKKKTAQENTQEPVVTSDELEEIVYVIKADGSVERRVVATGIQDLNYIEVFSGLKPGEKVVTGPYSVVSKTLRKGDKVREVKKEELFEN